MGKGIWQRCPKCGRWCSASKENFVGRIGRSYTIGDKEYGNKGSKIGEVLKMEDVGKTIGRIINALDTNKHITEILFGPNYLFYCECGCKFGTYNDEMDITRQIISIKNA